MAENIRALNSVYDITITDMEAGMTLPLSFTVHGDYTFPFKLEKGANILCQIDYPINGPTSVLKLLDNINTESGPHTWQVDFDDVPETAEEGDATLTVRLRDANNQILDFVVIGYLTILNSAPIEIENPIPLSVNSKTSANKGQLAWNARRT